MKCPKCAYVGFEETDRCRHCGYDFSLVPVVSAVTAAVASPVDTASPRQFASSGRAVTSAPETSPALQLDADQGRAEAPFQDLPLRAPAFPVLVYDNQPPPARTPLAVRRASADRPRSRAATQVLRRASAPLLDSAAEATTVPDAAEPASEVASAAVRLAAAIVDVVVLAGIDLAVVYLTAQLAGLPVAEAATLPIVPLGAFLLGLNVAYLAVFTASGGQTLGKMALGLRVVPLSGGLTPGDAAVRVVVALAGGVVMGAGFLPALVRSDGRAVHDFAARTRVVKVVS